MTAKRSIWLLIVIVFCFLNSCATEKNALYTNRVMKSLTSIKAGDWALYYINPDLNVRTQAIACDKNGVTIEYLTYFSSTPRATILSQRIDFKTTRRNLESGFDPEGKIPYLRTESLSESIMIEKFILRSEKWAVLTRDGVMYQWISDEIPLWGIAKQKKNEKYTMVVRAWGRAGEKILNWPSNLSPIHSLMDMTRKDSRRFQPPPTPQPPQ